MSNFGGYTNVETYLVARSLEEFPQFPLFSPSFSGLEKRLLIEDWVRGSGSSVLGHSSYLFPVTPVFRSTITEARDLLARDALEHTKQSYGLLQFAQATKYRLMCESPANSDLSAVGSLLTYALLDLDYKEISFHLLRGLPHPIEQKTYAHLALERLSEVYWADIVAKIES